jgi:hypothetical protein
MPILNGSIGPWGPTIEVKVMQTNQRVEALKKVGQRYSSPAIVLGLIDTGASLCALDIGVVASLGLAPRNVVFIHTPSTGSGYIKRLSYDAVFIVGESTPEPLSKTIQIVDCELASQGFFALIGRNVLDACQFTYDGPRGAFTLQYDVPGRLPSTTEMAAPPS